MSQGIMTVEPSTAASSRLSGATSASDVRQKAALIRRVNQLYHDMTQDVFDHDHHYRHRVEREFWRGVIRILNQHPESSQRTVVDLACGTGFITQLLGTALQQNDRLVAIDISSQALRSTAAKCGSRRLSLTVSDGAMLPLPDESVDLFAINAALHHMPAPLAVCREIDRVLKPNGWFALGYEPNARHFGSMVRNLSQGCDRLAWYASPRQNVRRLRTRLGLQRSGAETSSNDDRVGQRINAKLLEEGLIDTPLSTHVILDYVDPHARGADDHAGFQAVDLIRQVFPAYQVVRLVSSDYLGESIRRFPLARTFGDALLRAVLPEHGSLVSCILRKPARAGGQA